MKLIALATGISDKASTWEAIEMRALKFPMRVVLIPDNCPDSIVLVHEEATGKLWRAETFTYIKGMFTSKASK